MQFEAVDPGVGVAHVPASLAPSLRPEGTPA